ncbi:MAG: SET domain-containing protein [Bacteroidota bacterium]
MGLKVKVAHSSIHCRGVFSVVEINQGEIIEECPVVIINPQDRLLIEKTILDHYCYQWGEDEKSCVVALGFGSLYNHSYAPNAVYEKNLSDDMLIIRAIKPIKAGAEIFINYNMNPDDNSELWF